jgi:hypothetical protein
VPVAAVIPAHDVQGTEEPFHLGGGSVGVPGAHAMRAAVPWTWMSSSYMT